MSHNPGIAVKGRRDTHGIDQAIRTETLDRTIAPPAYLLSIPQSDGLGEIGEQLRVFCITLPPRDLPVAIVRSTSISR